MIFRPFFDFNHRGRFAGMKTVEKPSIANSGGLTHFFDRMTGLFNVQISFLLYAN